MRTPALLLLVACGGGDAPRTSVDAAVDAVLSPRAQLIRLSLDLRGVRPTEAELTAVDADPAAYDGYVDAWLRDPRFGDQVEDLYNPVLRTRTANTYEDPAEAGIDAPSWEVAASVGSEPLKLIRHVVEQDRPFTEILTADYTLADPIVAAYWDLPHSGASAWEVVRYPDGRPAAGVLATNTLWHRYPSAGLNANRHRANQLSRMFLCDDYLSRPVSFTREALDGLTPEEASDAIHTNATCLSCHASLDPIAANFYGFWWEKGEGLAANRSYAADDEGRWSEYFPSPPAYYGAPVSGLGELAADLAADPRFHRCTVQTVLGGLTQRAVDGEKDWEQVQALTDVFTESGFDFRALVAAIVKGDAYKAASFEDQTGERIPVVKTISPRQLSSYLADKTGYTYTLDGADLLREPELGLVVLANGIDGEFVTEPGYEPTVSSAFVVERVAQAAGYRVATIDLNRAEGTPAILLGDVAISDTPDTNAAAFEAQIRNIHLALVGVPLAADAPEVAERLELWRQVFSITSSPTSSWAAVLSATLRDPAVLFY